MLYYKKILFILPLCFFTKVSIAQNNTTPTPSNTISENTETIKKEDILDSEIYQITLNNNWTFSALTSFDKEFIFIPLKFFPSDVLGNLTETHMINGTDRSLKISKNLASTLDPDSLVLKLNLTEDYFKSQFVSTKEETKVYGTPINALFMNYDLNIPVSKITDTRGFFNFNWASQYNWIAKNEMLWNGSSAIRLNSTWKRQFNDNSLLIIGDTVGNTPAQANSLNFFGARYASAYFNSGSYINSILPTVPISGFAVNPTKLDIFLNNQLFQSSELNSGKYNINIPMQRQGYGVAEAFVYDASGKPIVVSVPFYGNNEIIKTGESAYDISGGMIRKNYAISSFDYESFIVNGLYKKGMMDGYTQDFFVQYSPLYSVASTIAHWVPNPKFGKLTLGYTVNSSSQQLLKLGYERSTPTFSFGGNIETSSKFCPGFSQACIKRQIQLFSTIPAPKKFGSFSTSFGSKSTDIGTTNTLSLQWNKQLNKEMTVFANIVHSTTSNSNNTISSNNNSGISFYVGLAWSLGNGMYSSSSLSKSSNGFGLQQGLSISEDNQNPQRGSGSITYSQNGNTQSLNGFYTAKLDKFAYQLSAFKDKSNFNLNANVTGSVSYIPEANYFSLNKQIQNGLTYVKVENTNLATPIIHSNKLVGYTNNSGDFVIPDSIALNQETVMIDINKLPPDITIEEYKKEYYIPFSGAVKVDFKSKPLPYIVYIKGVKSGAIFSIDKEYYVVGEDGETSIDANGKGVIPLDNGTTCELEFSNKEKYYDCTKGK